ncbi:NosD domain-containing protein [Halovenus salina]|uniref:NosD domain-containing protein n=2 Tax=Halovenus salina TaxID=1510225 RepID=A0ABD5W3A2_9EURY
MAPRTTLELTDGQGNAVASGDDAAGLVVDKPLTVTAADGATPTVGFANDGAEEPAAVLVTGNDVTVSGLVVDAEGAKTGIQVARRAAGPRGLPTPSGVTLRDLTVSGSETAVHTDNAPALRIANNNLTANTTGIRVGHRVPFRDSMTVSGRAKTTVRGNAITDVETGIDVAAQVAAIEGNDLSNIGGTGILVGTPRFLSRHFGQEIGPVRSNTVTGASRGIVVEGVMTRPVEENDLSDIAETALVVEGGVLAPVQANSVENAQRGITVGDEAEVATVSDNEFMNVNEPGDSVETDSETGTENQDDSNETPTATETPTTPTETETESTATPVATATDSPESDGSGPGLGVGSALAGLGGMGYLLKQRLSDDGTDTE